MLLRLQKIELSKRNGKCRVRSEIIKWLVNVKFIEMEFERRLEGGKGICGKSVPSRWNNLCKGSEARMCLSCMSKNKEGNVPKAEGERGRIIDDEVRGNQGPDVMVLKVIIKH